jgi:O-antigen/teichoic acid export membrane protein
MPFAVQTVLIHRMGIQYVGLQGVFRSILSVLSVAELGIGSAIVYSMYKPIANDDEATICALLGFYRKVYHFIGLFILLCGICVMPFLKWIVTDTEAEINMYFVFLLYLANTVISYFLFSYKTSLLIAFQRSDLISDVGIAVSLGTCLLQIVFLWAFKNFYIFLFVVILFTIFRNIAISIIVNHLYPELRCSGDISKELFQEIVIRTKGVLISKICNVTRNAFDSVFVSAFLGIVVAGIYSNYYYVMSAVIELLAVVSPALLGGVGNSIQLESVEKNYSNMRMINCIYMLISGWCATCLLCLYQPFMRLWAGGDNLFSFDVVILFTLYFFVRQLGNVRAIYSDAAGLFWENRYRNIAEAFCNLVLNYIFVIKFGVKGIVGATILSLFVFGYLGSTEVAFRHYFKSGMIAYLVDNLRYSVVTIVTITTVYSVCSLVNIGGYTELFIKMIICAIIAPILIFALGIINKQDRHAVLWFYRTVLKNKN